MTPAQLSSKVSELKGSRSTLKAQALDARKRHATAHRASKASEEAKAFLQLVAKQTQDQLRYHITELGTTALQAVFGTDDIALELEFVEKRGKTEAVIAFRNAEGLLTDPLEQDSGGAADIAALALRCSLWSLQKPRTRAVMVLDEPLKNINDPTREMQAKAAEMIQLISRRLGLQFIIVTMLQEIEDVAAKVFRF